MTVGEALAAGRGRLERASASPRLDAELLLGAVLAWPRSALLTHDRQRLDPQQAAAYGALLKRREAGEPVAYLLGRQGFWTLELQVSADVLVPRPETELLVEWALELVATDTAARVADLGTGSGAIALALARERPQAQIVATDASPPALAVAAENARYCGLGNLRFRSGSWWEAVQGMAFDLAVSNPPYIAADDPHLQALTHEPRSALTDEGDGLGCLREIVGGAPRHLRSGGWLLVEHGYDQGAAVRTLFGLSGFADVQTRRDLGGRERATGGRFS